MHAHDLASESGAIEGDPTNAIRMDDPAAIAEHIEALEAKLGLPQKPFDKATAELRLAELSMRLSELALNSARGSSPGAQRPPSPARNRPRRSRSPSPARSSAVGSPMPSPAHLRRTGHGSRGNSPRGLRRSSSPRRGNVGAESPRMRSNCSVSSEGSSCCSATSSCSSSLKQRPTSTPALRASHELSASLISLSRQGTPGPGAYDLMAVDSHLRRPINGGACMVMRSASPQRPIRPGDGELDKRVSPRRRHSRGHFSR